MTAPVDPRLVRIVKRLALVFALSVGIGFPATYFGLSYLNRIERVEGLAKIKAGAVSVLVAGTPELWRYQVQRLEELLLRYPLPLEDARATVRDAAGNSIVAVGTFPEAPVLIRASALHDSGRVIARVEIAHSYRDIVFGTLLAALLGVVLGALVYATVLLLPLRALRRVSAALVRESTALRAIEARYQALVETANDAIVTADREGTIVGWNPACERMFGYTETEAAGQPLTLVVPHRYRDRHLDGIQRIQAGGERRMIGKTVELVGLNKAGKELPIELALSAWESAEGRFFTGIIRDVTERSLAEQESTRQLEELRRWQAVMLGREDRIIALKRDVNELLGRLGEPVRYPSQEGK